MIVFCFQDHSLTCIIEEEKEEEEEAITSEVRLPSTPFPIAQGKKLLTSLRCVTRDVTTHRCVTRDVTTHRNESKSSSVAQTEHTSVLYR